MNPHSSPVRRFGWMALPSLNRAGLMIGIEKQPRILIAQVLC
jgi:hypothetical protein